MYPFLIHILFVHVFCDAEKKIDPNSVDLAKLRVAELKKILGSWGETCIACVEKTDYVQLIKELAPKYTAQNQRTDL